MASFVSLKVTIVDVGSTKTIQFAGNMSVNEVCREIRDRIGDKTSGATDHGLYFPFLGKWLAGTKSLDFYDIKSGDAVDFKKKHRPLRVRLMDGTIKTVLIDESSVVSEVVKSACKRIGITNPDEYSLQMDAEEAPKESAGKKRNGSKENVGPEELAEKWLNPEKTLSEQGVSESDMLLLKKKFFFSDQNIDRNDPIQLNLVYVQSRDGIVSGKHPSTFEEASLLAALQCQVQYGNHEPDKHKPGFIKLKDFIAPEYHKEKKDMEKKIFQEHRKLQGLSEMNAKFRYVQLCRSLKTYGVTFFLVKEKVQKKNKLIDRLLGVTRDSIMKVDAETKEIIKVWPLTTLRRWAAAQNSFTLDLGDYADAYYSVQTSEGEQISQLIGGYIDIILKRRKEAARAMQEEDEQMAISEDSIKPAKATAVNMILSKKGKAIEVNVAQASVVADNEDHVDAKKIVRKKQIALGSGNDSNENSGAQQGLLQNMNNGFASINAAVTDMAVPAFLPPLGNDAASQAWKLQTMAMNTQTIASTVGNHIASSSAMINLTFAKDIDELDFPALGSNIAALSSNLSQIASSAKMLAALMDPGLGDKLLEAARQLALATQKMLQNAQPFVTGDAFDGTPAARQQVLASAQEVSKSAFQVLQRIGEVDIPIEIQQEIIALARAVAQATVGLVTQGVKPVAGQCATNSELQVHQPQIVASAKNCAGSAEALVSTVIIAAPAVHLAASQDQILQGTLYLKDALKSLMENISPVKRVVGNDAKIIADLDKHAANVLAAIMKLLNKAKNPLSGEDGGEEQSELDRNLEQVLNACNVMANDNNAASAIITNAKALTVASTQLVNSMKLTARDLMNPDDMNRLLKCARDLTDATTAMINAAKDSARAVNDQDKKNKLLAAVAAIEQNSMNAAGPKMRQKIIQKLIAASKQAAASSTQLISASRAAAPSNRNQTSQMQLNQAAKKDSDAIGNLVASTRNVLKDLDDTGAQLKLIAAVKQVLQPAESLITSAKEAAATTGDDAAQEQLLTSARQNADDIAELRRVMELAEGVSSGLDFSTALETMVEASKEIQDSTKRLASGTLHPSLIMNVEASQNEIMQQTKAIPTAVTQILLAASRGNDRLLGSSALESATSFQTYTGAVKALTSLSGEDPAVQKKLLLNLDQLAAALLNLLNSAKFLSDRQSAGAPEGEIEISSQQVSAESRKINDLLASITGLLPGQRDIDEALMMVQTGVDLLENNPLTEIVAGETFQMTQNRLNSAASALAVACNNLVSAARTNNPQELKSAANNFQDSYNKLISSAQSVMARTTEENTRNDVLAYVKMVADNSSRLLSSLKSSNTDAVVQRNNLNVAAQSMADSISKLLETCTQNAPGTTELSKAEQLLIAASAKLDACNDPFMAEKSQTYFDSLKEVMEHGKVLSSSLGQLPSAVRAGDTSKIGQSLLEACNAISSISDCSARSAFLIGVSDPSSVPAVPGVLDQQIYVNSAEEVKAAFKKLVDPTSNQKAILGAAGVIAKNTSLLCTNAKEASQSPKSSSIAKQQFAQFSKSIASSTASVVTDIKALAVAPTPQNREKCDRSSKLVQEAIESLVAFTAAPEFASVPAVISPLALQKQAPLLEGNRNMISLARDLTSTAKLICAGRAEPNSLNAFTSQTKSLADSLRQLATSIKNGAPGQLDCDEAMNKINQATSELDSAILQVDIGSLSSESDDAQAQGYRDALMDNLRALSSLIEMICSAAKGKSATSKNGNSQADSAIAAGQLGAAVVQLALNFLPTSKTAVNLAMSTDDQNYQKFVLEGVKSIGDNAIFLLEACKESGGNPAATASHTKVNDSRAQLEASIAEITDKLEGTTAGTKEMSAVVKSIELGLRSLNLSSDGSAVTGSYQLYAQDIFKHGKTLVDALGELINKASTATPETIIPLSENIGRTYNSLMQSSQKASFMSTDDKIRGNILDSARELGGSAMKLIESLKGALASSSNGNGGMDNSSKQKVTNASREVTHQISKLMASAREGSKGLVACEQAIQSLDDVISDLESQIIFAQAGQLDPLDVKENFSQYKDVLQTLARDLVEVCKGVVSSSASANQEDLSTSVLNTSNHVKQIRDCVKKGATSITSSDKNMQEMLLRSTISTITELKKLIGCAMSASGKPMQLSATGTVKGNALPVEILALRDTAKNLVALIGELIKVIKLVGDESSRGLRTVEGARMEIDEALAILIDKSPAIGSATPEEVAQLAKTLASSGAMLVSAASRIAPGGKQDELISATNQLKKTILDLLRSGKSATEQAPDETRIAMHNVLTVASNAGGSLLLKVKRVLEDNSPASKADLQSGARDIAMSVNGIVQAAGALIPGGYVDPNDPNVIAERELLAAAASIEAAAKKLALLKPPERPKEANEQLNFEEQILEAAKAIAAATSALVRSATHVQREIVAKGKTLAPTDEKVYFSDGTWSDGLVSAAKNVGYATGDLCETANMAVKGEVQREKVVAAARAVSASTQQLLHAASVKSDPNSQAQIRLKAAGKAVVGATEQLVKAAENSMVFDDSEEVSRMASEPATGNVAQQRAKELEAQAKVLQMERELEMARGRLSGLRKGKYKGAK